VPIAQILFDLLPSASLEDLLKHGLHALRDTLQQDKELNTLNCSVGIVGRDKKWESIEGDALQRYLDLLDSEVVAPPVDEPQGEQGEAPMETE
jgi:20S proteasome subunit alpha 6